MRSSDARQMLQMTGSELMIDGGMTAN